MDKSATVIPREEATAELAALPGERSERDVPAERASGVVRCAFCGREGRWVRRGFVRRRRRELPEARAG